MKVIPKHGVYVLAMLLGLLLPAMAMAAPPVLQVLTVKVKGNSDAYVAKLKESKIKAILTRLGATNVRVFRATLAGAESGLIFISTEYPNMEAFGKAAGKAASDPELQKLTQDMDASGIREIVSRSLLEDVTPSGEGK